MILRNGKVVDYRRRIPVGIQVVVSFLEWHRICPDLVQESRKSFGLAASLVSYTETGT